jgi:hypothetical protein
MVDACRRYFPELKSVQSNPRLHAILNGEDLGQHLYCEYKPGTGWIKHMERPRRKKKAD